MNDEIKGLLLKSEKIVNLTIFDSIIKTLPKLGAKRKIVLSISGGSDSDILLDLVVRIALYANIPLSRFRFIFFDTGIEYQATKKHLDELEEAYGIKIERIKAIKPVPLGCRKYGVPFWSKEVSEKIERLQRHGFKWEDKPLDELLQEYPKCKVAVRWWCNDFGEKAVLISIT